MCHWLPQAQLQLSLIATGPITMCHYLPLAQPQSIIRCQDRSCPCICVGKPALFGLSDPSFGKNIYGHIPFIRSHYILMI